MICKVCGRTITNEEANFCEYCGASFRPGTDNKVSESSMSSGMNVDMNRSMEGNTQINNSRVLETEQTYKNMNREMPGQKVNQVAPLGVFRYFSGSNQSMTFGNWIAIYALPFIPVVGFIFFLVLLFSWGFGANTVPTKKSWARATMVMILVILVMFSFMLSSGYFGDYSTILNDLYGSV